MTDRDPLEGWELEEHPGKAWAHRQSHSIGVERQADGSLLVESTVWSEAQLYPEPAPLSVINALAARLEEKNG